MTTPLPGREAFDLPAGVTYLNCAYMAPQCRRVTAAGLAAVPRKSRPWEILAAHFFDGSERARGLFAQVVGGAADDVALLPAASYGLSLAASALPIARDQSVVVLAEQFPSNVYPWRERAQRAGARVVTVPRPGDAGWTPAVLDAIDARCAVVAVPQVHWTDGTALDLVQIGRRAREVGAALVLDLTQSLGAMPFDLRAVAPDFVVCAGYKWLLGPYSTGFLWIHPRWQDAAPLEHNWIARARSEEFAGLTQYRDELQPGARRFDVGERSNFVLLPMAIAGLELLLECGVDRIARRLSVLTQRLAAGARELGLHVAADDQRGPHMLGLGFPRGIPDALLPALADEKIFVSRRGNALRVSPHLYNDEADVDRLLAALRRLR
jgi:selenocysteine lyase/cysteine desulfurase